MPGALPYATAKAAIEGLTRALAVDYGPRGHPRQRGRARLDRHRGGYDAARGRAARACIRSAASGAPTRSPTVVAHLLSEAASFVNGAVVPVDGGRAALGVDPEGRVIGER